MSDQQLQIVESETNALLRMAVDKNLDMDKLERLIQLKNEQDARFAKTEYERHFAEMQAEFVPAKRVKQAYESKYAPLEELQKTYGPIIAKHGFSYRHRESAIEDAGKRVVMTISGWGHSEETFFDIPKLVGTKAMNAVQTVAAMSTYGRRYTFISGFGCIVEDEDTDAKLPPDPEAKKKRAEVINFISSVKTQLSEESLKAIHVALKEARDDFDKLESLRLEVERLISVEPISQSDESIANAAFDAAAQKHDEEKQLDIF